MDQEREAVFRMVKQGKRNMVPISCSEPSIRLELSKLKLLREKKKLSVCLNYSHFSHSGAA